MAKFETQKVSTKEEALVASVCLICITVLEIAEYWFIGKLICRTMDCVDEYQKKKRED